MTDQASSPADARQAERDHWEKTAMETSRRLGDTVRQLCLGGLAAIWVLKRDTGGGFSLAYSLKIATALLITTLLIDVLHGAVFFWLAQNKLAIAKGHPGSLFWRKLDKPRFTHGMLALRLATLAASFVVLMFYVIRTL